MNSLRVICRPHTVFSCCRSVVKVRVSMKNPNLRLSRSSSKRSVSVFLSPPPLLGLDSAVKTESWGGKLGLNQHKRMLVKSSSNWTDAKSPYDTLELERDADEE